jgi:hypothetical protein
VTATKKAMQQGHKKMCLRIGLRAELFSIIDASVQTVRETILIKWMQTPREQGKFTNALLRS